MFVSLSSNTGGLIETLTRRTINLFYVLDPYPRSGLGHLKGHKLWKDKRIRVIDIFILNGFTLKPLLDLTFSFSIRSKSIPIIS